MHVYLFLGSERIYIRYNIDMYVVYTGIQVHTHTHTHTHSYARRIGKREEGVMREERVCGICCLEERVSGSSSRDCLAVCWLVRRERVAREERVCVRVAREL